MLRLIFDFGGALYGLNLSAAGPYRTAAVWKRSNYWQVKIKRMIQLSLEAIFIELMNQMKKHDNNKRKSETINYVAENPNCPDELKKLLKEIVAKLRKRLDV